MNNEENMKYFWKVNLYEIQAIMYWILGVLILNIGSIKWAGWLSIGYGFFTFLSAMVFVGRHKEKFENIF